MDGSLRQALVVAMCGAACFTDADPVAGVGTAGPTSETATSASSDGAMDTASTTQAPITEGSGTEAATAAETTDPSTSGAVDSSSGNADASGSGGSLCGNGMLDPDEMCDGTGGCGPDCRFTSYDCNPLNNAGCVAPERCGLVDFATEMFSCMPAGTGVVGEVCAGAPVNDLECADSLTCLYHVNTPLCDIGNCCVEFCSTTGASGCGPGTLCLPFFPNPESQGLEHLGYCGS